MPLLLDAPARSLISSPELIQQAQPLTNTFTLRKRKFPLESMIWLIVGMSVFSNRPMTEIVDQMDICDQTGMPFTARNAVVKRSKTLGGEAVQ
ncbi:hypothetical protein V462_11010 [Pantoea ananatis 15320]|uniref:transposase domain-containing protein n=1 Tax=Pantoea ananas TaxID=553 RepID=UPI0004642D0F|nr:transposase domain-containing protein [Pantoea ananatis]PKC36125.1 hypothetical protein V462_11010 [Pantoea ananatis 15320]